MLLSEITLSGAIKKSLKPAGSIAKVLGSDADLLKLLDAKAGDEVLLLRRSPGLAATTLDSLTNSAYGDEYKTRLGVLKKVRLPGGAKVLVAPDGSVAVTSKHQADQLIENVITEARGDLVYCLVAPIGPATSINTSDVEETLFIYSTIAERCRGLLDIVEGMKTGGETEDLPAGLHLGVELAESNPNERNEAILYKEMVSAGIKGVAIFNKHVEG